MNKAMKKWCAVGLWMVMGVQSLYGAKVDGKIVQAQVESGVLHTFFNYTGEEPLVKDQITATLGDQKITVQEVESVREDMPPTSYLILMDVSTSIKGGDKVVVENFLEKMLEEWGEGAEFALMTFGEDVKLIQPFTADRFQLYQKFRTLDLLDESTNLYTAFVEGVAYYQTKAIKDNEKQHIVVITDGAEYDEQGITKEESYMALKQGGIPVYTLGLYRQENQNKSEAYMEELGSFARITGGKNLVYGQKEEVTVDKLAADFNTHILDTYHVKFDVSHINADGASYYLNIAVTEADGNSVKLGSDVKMDIVVKEESAAEEVGQPIVEDVEGTVETVDNNKEHNPLGRGVALGTVLIIGGIIFVWLKKRSKACTQEVDSEEEEVLIDTKDEEEAEEVRKATVRITPEMAPMHVELIEIGRVHTSRQLKIRLKDQVILGRSKDKSDVVLEADESVSSVHCKLFKQNETLYIVDLESTNGTYVNGIPTRGEVEIKQDDIILIGSVEYRIKWSQG